MKKVCLLFAVIILFVQPASALLRYREKQARYTNHPEQRQLGRYQHIASNPSFMHPERRGMRNPRVNPDDQYNITTPGVFSVVCATLSFVCLAAAGITAFSLLIIPVFVFAVLAAIFGSIGIKRHRRGYAIIGLALGILAMVGGFMVLALVL